MKKILMFMAIMIAVVFFASCSSKTKEQPKPKEIPFVVQTKENLKKWIDNNAINPEDFKISNYQVVWKTDSLCVINFRAIGENGFVGHVRNEFQYFNIKVDGILYEWCDNDRYQNGVLDCVKDGFKFDFMISQKDKTLLRLIKDKSKAGVIFANAYVDACTDYSFGTDGIKSGNILNMGNIQVADTIR